MPLKWNPEITERIARLAQDKLNQAFLDEEYASASFEEIFSRNLAKFRVQEWFRYLEGLGAELHDHILPRSSSKGKDWLDECVDTLEDIHRETGKIPVYMPGDGATRKACGGFLLPEELVEKILALKSFP